MLPILWAVDAQEDLAEIIAYIAGHSPQSAMSLYKHIHYAVAQLPDHPWLYRPGRVSGTRELVIQSNYVVVYSVGESQIDVLSVLHSRQQYP